VEDRHERAFRVVNLTPALPFRAWCSSLRRMWPCLSRRKQATDSPKQSNHIPSALRRAHPVSHYPCAHLKITALRHANEAHTVAYNVTLGVVGHGGQVAIPQCLQNQPLFQGFHMASQLGSLIKRAQFQIREELRLWRASILIVAVVYLCVRLQK
jgi:hypothetical protein